MNTAKLNDALSKGRHSKDIASPKTIEGAFGIKKTNHNVCITGYNLSLDPKQKRKKVVRMILADGSVGI